MDGDARPLERLGGYAWRFLAIVAAAAVIVVALIKLRIVVLPVIAALFVATLLAPPAKWLCARGWKPLLATWTIMLAAVLLFAGLIALIAPQVARELDDIGEAITQGSKEVVSFLTEGPLDLSQKQIDNYVDQAVEQVSANRERIASGLLSGAAKVLEVITEALLALVLLFFFVKDGGKMWAWFTRHFNDDNRRHVDALGQRVWQTITAYLRGIAIVGFVDAILIGIALLLVGVPLVIPLMVLQFFGGFFPIVGAIAAGTVAALVALVTKGAVAALIIAGAILVIQQVEGDVLQPVVMGRAVKLHPVVILLALAAGAVLGGVVGAFLGVPVAAIASTVGNYVNRQRLGAPEAAEARSEAQA